MSSNSAPTPVASKPRVKPLLVGVAIIAVLAVSARFAVRAHQHHELAQWTAAQQIPTVQVIQPRAVDTQGNYDLPGQLQAWMGSPIHAQVSGYLKSWNVDIGSKVKAGQLLATIETPALDQQLEQAKADQARAQASASLAEITAKRWHNLLASNSVSKQEADEKAGEAEAALAAVQAAKANVDRLNALESFKHVVAPFDGTITNRSTDVGDLISAGDNSNSTLFTLADTSRMRLYMQVPQAYAGAIKPGVSVALTVPEHPGRIYHASLLGNSGAMNARSGSMLVQFEIDNSDQSLHPGDYADVRLPRSGDQHLLSVPATVLLFRDQGPQVAVLGKDGKIEMRDVHIAQDEGVSLQIDSGLKPGDQVVDHPPDSLAAGDTVRLAVGDTAANEPQAG